MNKVTSWQFLKYGLFLSLMLIDDVTHSTEQIFKDETYLKNEFYKDDFRGIKETPTLKRILIYTPLFKSSEWPNLKAEDGKTYLKRFGCPVTNCHLEYNNGRNELHLYDVVVFHERDMPDYSTLKYLSENERPKGQLWVYFTGESPANAGYPVSLLDDLFEWTMTYKHTSDIWVPYARFYQKRSRINKDINFAAKKTKPVAWIVSKCGGLRESIAHELNLIIPVHVAGQCSTNFPNSFTCQDWFCQDQLNDYKFYLAFENSHCEEYVTEKYWYKSIKSGVVPVVLGGGPYKSPHVAIPGSYINALDFKTIADLGRYLKYLDKNDTAYNEYFKWKNNYELWKPVCDWPFEPYWACQMCVRLNKGINHKERVKLSEFWSVHRNCRGNEIEELLRRSGHDPSTFQQSSENIFGKISKELDYEEEKELKEEPHQNIEDEDTNMDENKHYIEKLLREATSSEDSGSESYLIVFLLSIFITGLLVYKYNRIGINMLR